jgi:asparagine synthase (glutamine-hydrolysing)
MCGFAGAMGGAVTPDAVCTMARMLKHRGPDDSGVWVDAEAGIGLGHARLSIIDLSAAGHQPMTSPAGRYVLAFNGEIYNHEALREELRKSGQQPTWRGHSDTETLLACFDAFGIERTVTSSVGMFAFGVWDQSTRELTLVRDRMGEKPLYYGWQDNTFLFGSELKALRAHPAFKASIDRDALAGFMRHGYVAAPRSIYQQICKLMPGTMLSVSVRNRDSQARAYWSLQEVIRQGARAPFQGNDADAVAELEAVLRDAVRLQSVADVPLGAFLSGGIDSSLIVALMQTQSSSAVRTFTVGFHDRRYDEASFARKVAAHLRTEHTEVYVTPDEALAVIPRLPTVYDEPFADSSQIPTYLVSEIARRSVTVSLSGDGADELFYGYDRYRQTTEMYGLPVVARHLIAGSASMLSASQWNRLFRAAHAVLPKVVRNPLPGDNIEKAAAMLRASSYHDAYQTLISTWRNPGEVVLHANEPAHVTAAWEQLHDVRTNRDRMMGVDALTYLPDDILCKVDRAAMAVSLETRVPYLDHRVVEFAWRLPLTMKLRNGSSKWVLRQLLKKYVPTHLTDRPKMGFGVPIGAWLRGPLREWAHDLLDKRRIEQEGYLNAAVVGAKWNDHLAGKRNWQHQLWNVLMFQAWMANEDSAHHNRTR